MQEKMKNLSILATTEFVDTEMAVRIQNHKSQRHNQFTTIEEALKLTSITQESPNNIVLIECVSMWINNMLYHGFNESDIIKHIRELSSQDIDMVFVINDVSCSVVSDNALTRSFVDINGRVSQYLASHCQEVYNTVAGISIQIK